MGTSGALDDLEASRVGEFEKQFLAFMNDSHPEAAEAIATAKKDIPDDVKAQLDAAAKTVKAQLG